MYSSPQQPSLLRQAPSARPPRLVKMRAIVSGPRSASTARSPCRFGYESVHQTTSMNIRTRLAKHAARTSFFVVAFKRLSMILMMGLSLKESSASASSTDGWATRAGATTPSFTSAGAGAFSTSAAAVVSGMVCWAGGSSFFFSAAALRFFFWDLESCMGGGAPGTMRGCVAAEVSDILGFGFGGERASR